MFFLNRLLTYFFIKCKSIRALLDAMGIAVGSTMVGGAMTVSEGSAMVGGASGCSVSACSGGKGSV